MEFLTEALENPEPIVPPNFDCPAEVREVLDTLETVAQFGPESFGAYVISMARGPSDVLSVALLQKLCGVARPLRIAPLFETKADLSAAPQTMAALYETPWYRRHIPDAQEVPGPAPGDASQGTRPRRRPQVPGDGRLEAVAEAVWGRLLSVTNAMEAGTWRQGGSGWA